MNSKPDIYLEISGRASAKTWRMAAAMAQWLSWGDRTAVIHTLTERCLTNFLNHPLLPNTLRKQVVANESEARSGSEIRHFYDEFDHYESFQLSADPSGYYVTSPARLRTLDQVMDPKSNDPFVQLLRLTRGRYVSHVSVCDLLGCDAHEFNEARRELSPEVFAREFAGQWIKS